MGGELRGDAINAVLIEPQVERFEELTGADPDRLDVDVRGWNKRVLLGEDRVFLFPRVAENLEWFERELAVYAALAHTDVTIAPRLLARWEDSAVYPFPFAAVTRLRGEVRDDATGLFGQLGDAIAQWHSLPIAAFSEPLAGARPQGNPDPWFRHWMRRALDPVSCADAAAEAADRLDRRTCVARWTEVLGRAAELPHVLVHGDIHEHQLLAHEGVLTGILDWETARIDHPFCDFDLGEWGTGLWRHHRHRFTDLRAEMWRAYAGARGLDPDPTPLDLVYRIRQALYLSDGDHDRDTVGTFDEEVAALDRI